MIKQHEDGFTLIEILVVIAIISILFIVLLPSISNSIIKANESGTKTNFRDFQIAAETFLREANGKNLNSNKLNLYLDKAHELQTTDANIITRSKDAWGNPYIVEFGDRKITFYSNGETENKSEKAYTLSSYYYKGTVSSCTKGFAQRDLVISLPDVHNTFHCGENLPDATNQPTVPTGPVDSDGDRFTDEEEIRWGTNPHDPNENPSTTDIDGDGIPDYIDVVNERKINHNLMVGYYRTSNGDFDTGINWHTFKINDVQDRKFILKSPSAGEVRLVNFRNNVFISTKKLQVNTLFQVDDRATEFAINLGLPGASPNNSPPYNIEPFPTIEAIRAIELWEVWDIFRR